MRQWYLPNLFPHAAATVQRLDEGCTSVLLPQLDFLPDVASAADALDVNRSLELSLRTLLLLRLSRHIDTRLIEQYGANVR